jgi:hypothetical protein
MWSLDPLRPLGRVMAQPRRLSSWDGRAAIGLQATALTWDEPRTSCTRSRF